MMVAPFDNIMVPHTIQNVKVLYFYKACDYESWALLLCFGL